MNRDQGPGTRGQGREEGAALPAGPVILHPLSFILRGAAPRSGISLLEVLVSIFVLSVGLLGLAALLPVGSLAILETNKADRAGNCGRAALRAIKACKLLSSANWSNPSADTLGSSFAVDPMGLAVSSSVANTIPRIGLSGPLASVSFFWPDDLTFVAPTGPGRPNGIVSTAGLFQFGGDYSWFFTVTPLPTEFWLRTVREANAPSCLTSPYHYLVSVVVCYKRNVAGGEKTATVTFLSGGVGGGDLKLTYPGTPPITFNIKENDWIALCGQVTVPNGNGGTHNVNLCQWYRVVAVGDNSNTPNQQYVTVNGPDWLGGTATAVAIDQSIVGVYTEAIELDRDTIW